MILVRDGRELEGIFPFHFCFERMFSLAIIREPLSFTTYIRSRQKADADLSPMDQTEDDVVTKIM